MRTLCMYARAAPTEPTLRGMHGPRLTLSTTLHLPPSLPLPPILHRTAPSPHRSQPLCLLRARSAHSPRRWRRAASPSPTVCVAPLVSLTSPASVAAPVGYPAAHRAAVRVHRRGRGLAGQPGRGRTPHAVRRARPHDHRLAQRAGAAGRRGCLLPFVLQAEDQPTAPRCHTAPLWSPLGPDRGSVRGVRVPECVKTALGDGAARPPPRLPFPPPRHPRVRGPRRHKLLHKQGPLRWLWAVSWAAALENAWGFGGW